MSNLELTVTRTIPAAREAVFNAWLDAEAMKTFMCPGESMSCPTVEVDPREGGAFLVVMLAGDKEMPHKGEYKKVSKYDELAFSWLSPFAGDQSLVTLTFEDADGGATKLTLHHTGLPNEDSRSNHEGGWTRIVELLSGQLS